MVLIRSSEPATRFPRSANGETTRCAPSTADATRESPLARGDFECQPLRWPVHWKAVHQLSDGKIRRLQTIENHFRDVLCKESAAKRSADIALGKASFGRQ